MAKGNERRAGAQRAQAVVQKKNNPKPKKKKKQEDELRQKTTQKQVTEKKQQNKPVSSKGNERREGAKRAQTNVSKATTKVSKSGAFQPVNVKKQDKTNYVKTQGGTSTGDAAKAYNKAKRSESNVTKATTKKTLTVSQSQLKEEQDRAKRETAFWGNNARATGRATTEDVQKAQKKAAKEVKKSHTLEYSNAPATTEEFNRIGAASQFANNKVKDVKETDRAKREARFYANQQVARGEMTKAEAKKLIREAAKGHYTSQGNNILDKLGGEGTAEKVGTKTAGWLNDSKFAAGAMQGLSYSDITKGVGKYNQQAAELVDKTTKSGAFNAGYMAGQMGQFMLGGTNKMTDALVKGVAKTGAKRSALNIGLRKGAADAMFEAPLNTLDAIKMSTDANGNFDKNTFAKYMALNTGLSGGMGAVIGGAGAKYTKAQAKNYIALSAKANAGLPLTEAEMKKLTNIRKSFESASQGNDIAKNDIINSAKKTEEVGQKLQKNGNTVDGVLKTLDEASSHTEKMEYASALKSTADTMFEQTRAQRNALLEKAKTASPEEAKKLRAQASSLMKELDSLGEMSNVVARQAEIANKKNRTMLNSLKDSVAKMSDATGVNYRILTDKDMKKVIAENGGDVSDEYFYKGFYYKNKDGKTEILINADSPQAHQTVIGHETGHLIKTANEDEFNELGKMLEDYARKSDDYDAVVEQLKKSYPEATEKELQEEVTCELLGRYVYGMDDKFIKRLAGEKPSVLEQILDYFKRLFESTEDKEMRAELKTIMDKVEGEVGKVGKKEVKAEDKPKFSIVKKVVADDGTEYENVVKLDTNKFNDIGNKGERSKAFKDFVFDNLAGEKFEAKDAGGNPITIEFARLGDKHRKDGAPNKNKTLNEIAVKTSKKKRSKETQVAVSQANELIEVSKYDKSAPTNAHGDLDANGWEYRTLPVMAQNGNIYDCVLNIAKSKDGRNILYDVELTKKTGMASRTAESGSAATNLKETLPQKENSVNNKFSKEKKSTYNYSGEKPKSKIVEKTNKLQAENNEQIAKMTTSNNPEEVAEAVKKSDELEKQITAKGAKPERKVEQPQAETPKETPKTEVGKLQDNDYVSKEVKTALKDIEEAGIYKGEAEKAAKKFNDLDKKIGAQTKHIENAKNKEYPTIEEKNAHIKELEDELSDLKNKQKKVAGEIEQYGKMKPVDNSKTAGEQIRELHGDRKVNKEVKEAQNLKNEDSWIKDKWNSVRRLWEDSLIDVENVAKKSKDKTLREEILTSANRVRNSMSVANNWITKARKSFDNKVGGKSLDEIFTKDLIENEAKYADFQEYLVMKHVPARHAKGTDIYADISPELAAKRVSELEADYGEELTKWADDVYSYLKDLQQYRVDSGMLSKEAAEQFAKDYPFYVPTNRVNEETINFFTGGSSNGIRTAKGGESQVLDMYSQIYTATNKTIHAAEENQMLNLYFRAKGITKQQIEDYTLDDMEHAVINATVNKKSGDAKVSFFIDGKPVEVPCSHQLALGLRELDGLEFERLMKAAKVATLYGKPFKALVTDWNLVFGVRNGMRDIQQAVVNSKDTRYFGSSMGAAAHAIAHEDSPYRKLYSSMGGEQAQLVSYDAVAKQMGLEKAGKVDKIHEGVQDWVDASVNVKGKEINTNPIHYIEGINGAIEMMPRMSEFIGTLRKEADKMLKQNGSSLKKLRKEIIAEVDGLEKAGKIGQSEKSAKVEDLLAQRVVDMVGKDTIDSAMRNANDITLNFGRSGVLGKALNMGFVPYLNPSIQGLSKLVRLFTEAGGEGGWKALTSLGMKIGAFNVSFAAINEIALRDNEDYQNLNTRDKDNNFFIPLGGDLDGKFIKIPKPRENAVLIEPVEYALRYAFDNTEYAYFDWDKLTMESEHLWDKIPLTEEGKQSFRTAIDNIGVINPMTSNMFSPLAQTFNNKTWYGGNIESAYETSINEETGKANVPVNKRYDTGTSAIAIALGQTAGAKALNLSPKKIDNIMDSYLGMIYDLGISQTTEEAKTRGNYLVRTVASQFMKDAVFSNKLSTNAWAKVDGMKKSEADAYKSTYMYDAYKYDDAMDLITADKNMTVQEKMAAKRALQKQKNAIYRNAIDGKPNNSNPLVDISKHLGAHKTLNKFLPNKGSEDYETWADYYKSYKSAKGFKGMNPKQKEKEAQKFLDVYSLGVKGQLAADPTKYHDSPSWGMTGVAAAQLARQGKLKQKDATTIMQSCGVYESQTAVYYNYADHGGTVKRYAVTMKNVGNATDLADELGVKTKGDGSVWTNKYDKSKGIKGGVYSMSLATGKAEFKDRAYYIANSSDENMLIKMNAARGYSSKYKHTTEQLIKLGKKADADGNTYLSNDEIIDACNTIRKGKATNEEKAMAWVLLGGKPSKNPFGAIGDYSLDGDTGIEPIGESSGKGGGRGRRHGHRGGGGGGSKKGKMPSTASGAIKGKVTNPFSTSNGSSASNLNDAYRKRAQKLREATRK